MSAASSNHLSGLSVPQTRVRHRLSLRWRLVLLVVALVVPLLAFSLGHQYLQYREAVATTGHQTLALARSMSLVVEQELQARIAALQALTVSSPLQGGDLAGFRAQAETVVAQQFPGANIVLLKEDGQQVINTILPAGAPLPVRPNLESTRQVFATGRPAVSNLYQGAVGPRPVVAIDVPVKAADGTVIYVLSLNPRLEAFAEAIRRQQTPATWVVSVFDRRGVNIARIPNADRFVGHEASPSLLGPLRAEREGIVETTSLEGIPLLTVFSHAEPFGWAVAIGVPRAELTGPPFVQALRTLAVGSALLAVGLALALYAARRIASPIESLRRLAAATDRDALLDPVPTGLREVDEVARAFRVTEEERRRSRQAEVVLRDGIETIPEGFSIYDGEDRLVMCNDSYRRLSADNPDDVVLGTRYEDFLRAGVTRGRYPQAKGHEEQWIAARLREHRDPAGAIEQQLADGRWVLITKRRLSNGWIAGLRVDITALKAAQMALTDSERRFQDIAEVSGDWMWETDCKHRLTLLLGERTDATPLRRETLLGRTRWEIAGSDPVAEKLWVQHKAELDAHQPFRRFRYEAQTPDGGRMHVSVSGKPIFDETHNFLGYRGTATDETAIVEAGRRVEAAEALLRDAIDSISGGFLISDADDRLVLFNQRLREYFPDCNETLRPGAPYRDFLWERVQRGYYPPATGRKEAWFAEAMARHRDANNQAEIRLHDGRWLLVTERRMSNGGIAGVSLDITAMKAAEEALRRGEEQFRRVFETSLDLIVVTDRRGTLIRVSPSAMSVLGYDPDELVGRSGVDLVYSEDLEATRNEMRRARRGGTVQNFECRYVHKHGRIVSLWWTGAWSASEQQHFFIGRDITDRKESERRLRESEEQLKRAQRLGQMGSNLSDVRTGAVEWSDETYRIYGVSRDTFVPSGPSILGMIHPGDRARVSASMDQRRQGIAPAPFEYRLIRPDGTVRHIYGESEIIKDEDGNPRYVAGVIHDITRLKAAEEALRESEEQLKRAQRLAQMGSDVRNLRTDEAEWSDESYRIFGVSRESFVPSTENFLRMVHPDDRATVLETREEIQQGICPASFEYRIIRPDGTMRQVYRENELIRDEAGTPLYLAGTIHDVTERRNTEHQLRQAQKMEAIGNLTGGMAHDFNNLLGIIVGNLDLARERVGSDDELREIVDEALEAALRGADLTGRLLAFARRQPLRPVRIDVNKLVSDTMRLMRRLLGEDIEISLELAETIWPVTVDPAQLEASLANLATNARDAMPKGGRLIITTANRRLDADYAAAHADVAEGDFVMIEVSDTGTGMSAEIISQVFDPFFTTKETGKGTGLGLSMVFGFLRQSGGHVNVYSEPDVGTTFRLYLPRMMTEALPREVAEARPVEPAAGETVLVVEDDPAVRRIVLRQLGEFGYRVLECDRAATALELLQREPVDLLLTDIVMPGGLDGIALARMAVERWPALKIVLTSGFPQARVEGNGELLGNMQLLSKPYRRTELAAALRMALAR